MWWHTLYVCVAINTLTCDSLSGQTKAAISPDFASQKTELEREGAEHGVSRSESIRGILDERFWIDNLQRRFERNQDRVDELEPQLTERSKIEAKIESSPDKIQDELSYQDRRHKY